MALAFVAALVAALVAARVLALVAARVAALVAALAFAFVAALVAALVVAFFAADFGATALTSPLGVLAIIALLTVLRFAINDFFSTVLPPQIFFSPNACPS